MVGVGHHGYEHVEEDDHVAAGVHAKHQQRPEPCEVLHSGQFKIVETDQSKHSPEQGLESFKQTGEPSPDETSRVFSLAVVHVPKTIPFKI